MSIKIRDIPYETQFYWKGQRYKQFVRLKKLPRKATVVCYLANQAQCGYINMPANRIIKPIIRIKL